MVELCRVVEKDMNNELVALGKIFPIGEAARVSEAEEKGNVKRKYWKGDLVSRREYTMYMYFLT
jgi:hypothetical protein